MKSVLVTGGTGSFGHAMIPKLIAGNHDRIVVYSRDEQKQEVMARQFPQKCMRWFIGDVRDCDRLQFASRGIDTIIHAAALKIVPTAEYNPTECVATNITGAENVVRAAIRSNVKRVVALSTDKAVNPINLYGASKLCAEKIFLAANFLGAGNTIFSVVRYGNVAGSRGSVLPLFLKLSKEGKPLPITDPRMTRFWLKLDQATDLVEHAIFFMTGREVFIPKIPSMKVVDLAEAIGGEITLVGIRPGEKLHETLISEDEARSCHDFGRYLVIAPKYNGKSATQGYSSDNNSEWLSADDLKEYVT